MQTSVANQKNQFLVVLRLYMTYNLYFQGYSNGVQTYNSRSSAFLDELREIQALLGPPVMSKL